MGNLASTPAPDPAPDFIPNSHPALQQKDGWPIQDMLSNWVLFLPPAAVRRYGLEPNFEKNECSEKTLWVGRMKEFRRILWLKYCATRSWSTSVDDESALAEKFGTPGTPGHTALIKLQHRARGWFVRHRSKPHFIEDLIGHNIRSIVVYMHGSGGLTWANPRLCRIAAGFGCVVFAPDHMSSDEWRARELAPLHTAADDTGYWQNSLFYTGKKEVHGESLAFNTSVEGVLGKPDYYKKLYQKVFEVRSSELHFLLKHLPKSVHMMGVTLMGTSEGAMTVSRFDDKRYGNLITARVINAFACEYCYFTPTREAAALGGQLSVPTLNIIGTHDQYFGPAKGDTMSTVLPGWDGSIASKIAADKKTGYGDVPTGNAFASFVRQGMHKGLVATIVGCTHDATLKGDNSVTDVLLSFLAAPSRCTELMQGAWSASPYLQLTSTVKGKHQDALKIAADKKTGQDAVTITRKVLWIEIEQKHGIAPTVEYFEYKKLARAWARKEAARLVSLMA